jgi:glycosyltransferase involved in cell wall biosynthesis
VIGSGKNKKVCLVANTDWYLYNFRLVLAKTLRNLGWDVVLISPRGSYVSALTKEEFRWLEWNVDRRSMNIFGELVSMIHLARIYASEKPLLTHHHTIKPVIYGSLSARLEKIPAIVNSITGLGYVFSRKGWQGALMRAPIVPLYRLALKQPNTYAIFENEVDRSIFIEQHFIHQDKSVVIEGVGVDIQRFNPHPESQGIPLVVMPARLLWDKGIGVLIEAAKKLHNRVPIRIALVGMPDPGNPSNIDEAQLHQWVAEGLIEYWGFRTNMEEVYRQAHIVCLPSMREGLPTVLIEAAAAGRPIVATDVPGCRQVVAHGDNGYLVPVGDADAFAEALERLSKNPGLRKKMGEAGREIAVSRYSSEKVIDATLKVYSTLLS